MTNIYEIDGVAPVIHPSAFVHPAAVIIGDVTIGAGCYVAPGASMRGDMGPLVMADGANLQDNCVVHGFPGTTTTIGRNGHIGHGSVLHGCTIGENALVGMSAVVMDNAVIGESAFVAAMAFVKAGFAVPARTLVAGIPAKVTRDLTDKELAWKVTATQAYQDLAVRSRETMRPITPYPAADATRGRVDAADVASLHATKKGT
jgi:phenylacetic acid degradation protein